MSILSITYATAESRMSLQGMPSAVRASRVFWLIVQGMRDDERYSGGSAPQASWTGVCDIDGDALVAMSENECLDDDA